MIIDRMEANCLVKRNGRSYFASSAVLAKGILRLLEHEDAAKSVLPDKAASEVIEATEGR